MEIEELTIEWYDNGELVVEELDKFILSKGGAWTTVVYLYRERGRDGEFGDKKVRLVKYQKRNGKYNVHSKFNITNEKQVKNLVAKLNEWFK